MKRFFIIFLICFASLIGVLAGIIGIKYLKGDFNPVIVNPENISFDFETYEVVDNFTVTITTTTEGVTATNVELSFAKGTVTNTFGEGKITDGVIAMPKQVQIGIPFEITLRKTNDPEANNLLWNKGGISNIVAKSECVTTPQDTAVVYVDVPVYKTELVVFSGDGQISSTDSYVSPLTYLEGQASLVKDVDKALNAGDTFYVGLKYYPERSTYKYSKISSSNILVEYSEQILAKIEELGLTEEYTEKFETLNNLFVSQEATTTVSIQELINAYTSIVDFSQDTNTTKVGQLTQYLSELNAQFESNLKYYTFEEAVNNEQTYLTKIGKIAGTNLYKVQATTDSVLLQSGATANLYAYTFANSKFEQETLAAVGNNYTNLLATLENLNTEQGLEIENKKVDKPTLAIDIVDVDVDIILMEGGEIKDFPISKVHTIYLAKQGTTSDSISYLNIQLKNSKVESVNLQNKLSNVGIRFEKRVSTNTWGDADEISFVDKENYSTVDYNGKTYYLPLGNSVGYLNTYWQIYSDSYISNELRAEIVCFKGDTTGEILAEQVVFATDKPIFKLDDPTQTEQMVQWTDAKPISLGVVDITGTVDMTIEGDAEGEEALKNVIYNTEVDLSKYVNIPLTNYYQTYKFFLYSDDTDAEALAPISDYFYVTEETPKQYPFYGTTKNLYELDGNILKLKSTKWPSTYTVKVIFATIKTGALRAPILTPIYDIDGETILDYRYTFVKYSAVKDNIVENISYISINFTSSIKTLSGAVSNALRTGSINEDVAGVAQDGLFKVAQNATNALILTVNCSDEDASLVKSAIDSGNLRVEARIGKTGAINYIDCSSEYIAGKNYFIITTSSGLQEDVVVRLYLVYNVDGEEYLFPVTIDFDKIFHKLTIVKNTSASAKFNFFTASGVVDVEEINYIQVVTDYAKNPDGSDNTSKFEKSFYVYYKDSSKNEDELSKRKISISDATTNKVLVEVIDFLGNTTTKISDWYLTTSYQSVVSVSENQKLNFIGVCDIDSPVTVSLCLANGTLQQTVNFVVNETGYASSVVANPETINETKIFEYDPINAPDVYYSFAKQTVAVNESKGANIQIDDLLRIFYKLNSESNANKLPMLVYIANEASLNALKAVASSTDTVQTLTIDADQDTYYEKNNIEQITLNKDLGSVVSVDLLFVCIELGITQAVTLKFNQTISITDVVITNVATNNNVVIGSSVYHIFAGIDYQVALTSASSTFYWYIDGETDESKITPITNKTFNVIFEDGCIPQQKIHITATKTFPVTGDLNYILEFNVQKNISLKTINQLTYNLFGNTLEIPLTDLFDRLTALTDEQMLEGGYVNNPSLSNYCILGDITFDFDVKYAQDNTKIKNIADIVSTYVTSAETRNIVITFNEFSDDLDIVLYIKCNGEILGERISLKVLPENLQSNTATAFAYYNGKKAIVVSNGQTVKSATSNWFEGLFDNEATVACDDSFFATYTTTDGGITKVVLSANTLFENTEKKITVTKDGISTNYIIIISKLAFPFVQFVDLNGNALSFEELDIFYLFEETTDILNYYETNGIASFVPTVKDGDTEASLLLANTEDDTNTVLKLSPFGASSTIRNTINFNGTLGSIEVLKGSLSANSYAAINADTEDNLSGSINLDVKPVGEDVYLKVVVHLLPNGSSTYYEIPVVVKIEVSQILKVTYPFSGYQKDSSDTTYATEEYDQTFLLDNASTFENAYKYMEYLAFDVNGKASLNLLDTNYNRLSVYKGDELDLTYDGIFKFEIVKVAKNQNGVWSLVDLSNFVNYAYFDGNVVSSTNGLLTVTNAIGGTALRVKIKVTTSGGAINYYYVSVGEQLPLTLNRQKDTINVSVGTTDSITVSAGNVLLIGSGNENDYTYSEANPLYYYYLSNAAYNKELRFRLFDDNEIVIPEEQISDYVIIDNNKLTIAVQPLGVKFKIQVYTSYGILALVGVTVEPSITVNLTPNTIYSGTSYAFDEIINIIPGTGISSVNIVNVICKTENIFYTCETDSFSFAHIPAAQVQLFSMHLQITVKIDGKDFVFEHTFDSVTLTPRIVAVSFDNGFYRDETGTELTTYIESNGIIELSNNLWINMFNDLKASAGINVSNETTLKYYIEGLDVTEYIKDATITWTIGYVLTDDEIRNWTFVITDNQGQMLTSAYAKITVKPQYDIIINYPIVVDEVGDKLIGLSCEYVQNGGSIDFNTPNFASTEKRINVLESVTGTNDYTEYTGYNIVFEGAEGEYASKVEGDKDSGFTFNFVTNDFASKTEIECRFNVIIGEGDAAKIYATYVVKVLKDSPFMLETDYLENVVYGYGTESSELFKTVDVYVTLPSVQGFTTEQKIDLYVDNGSITRIATDIYYRAGDRIHALLNIVAYSKDLKVYICESGAGELGKDTECLDVEFKVRATLRYQGYQVQYKDYSNIMGDAETSLIADINNVQTYSASVAKSNSLSIVSSDYVVQGVYLDFAFDIIIDDTYAVKEKALILNANQVENGQSFVDLFNVQDSLGNTFWYNQLGGTKNTSLNVVDLDGAIECLPVYPRTIEDTFVFDYLLKPLGAKNDGTMCQLTFKYTYDSLTYTKVLFVKVISDLEFQVYNNDGTTTPNSQTNPLKISADSGDITFVSIAQTKYIYAYSKYSQEKSNVAQQLIFTVQKLTESATDYITIKKLSNPTSLIIDVTPGAKFGNKTIQLVLKDMYGFEINYYIELVADINVTSITTVAGKVFEGGEISVYNKNVQGASGTSGSIAITLNNKAEKDTKTEIQIYEVSFWYNGKTLYSSDVINGLNADSTRVKFNFLSYDDIWNPNNGLTNGYSFTGSLHIVIGQKGGETNEKYSFDVGFTLYKKYSFDLSPENTYIRESVEVDLTHFIDVYDYSQEAQLGKPTLEENEEIKAELTLNKHSVVKNEGKTTDLLADSSTLLYTYINTQLNRIHNASSLTEIDKAWTALAAYGIQQDTSEQGSPIEATESTFNTGMYSSYLQKDAESNLLMTYADLDGNGIYELEAVDNIKQAIKDGTYSSSDPNESENKVFVRNSKGDIIYQQVYSLENLGIYINVQAVHKTNGSTIERLEYVNFTKTDEILKDTNNDPIKDDEGNDIYVYTIEYRKTLGGETADFGSSVTTQDYYFNIYLCSIGETVTNKKKVATTIEGDLGENNAVNNQILTTITSGSLYTVKIVNSDKLDAPINLAFTLNNDTNVIYVINNYHVKSDKSTSANIFTGNNIFYLYDGYYSGTKYVRQEDGTWSAIISPYITFEGQKVDLYTGKINSTVYVNGISTEDAKAAKNILGATYFDGSEIKTELTYTGSLSGSIFNYNSDYGIYYQNRDIENVKIFYKEYGDSIDINPDDAINVNAQEEKDLTVNVTLKYTGVNTENAYVGSQIHYVYMKNLKVNEETGAIEGDSIKINFLPEDTSSCWADGFALKTGVGVANILAGFENKEFIGSNLDESSNEILNVDSLSFEAGELIGSTTALTSSLFDVEESSGDVTLKIGFVPNSYYISIIVKCRYNRTEVKEIGTIYLAFVAVDEVDIYNIAEKQYRLDITEYVTDTITLEQIKLEGSITQNVYQEEITGKWYAIFDNSNESIVNGRSLLTVGSVSKYVYLNVHQVSTVSSDLTIYKIGDSKYAINGKDILILNNGVSIDAVEYNRDDTLELGQISVCEVPSSAIQNPVQIISGAFEDDAYFVFDDISKIINNETYYIGYNSSYCKVTINIQNMYIDQLVIETNTETSERFISLKGKSVHKSADETEDFGSFLEECSNIRINGSIVEVNYDGTDYYINNFGQELDTNWSMLTFEDQEGNTYRILINLIG